MPFAGKNHQVAVVGHKNQPVYVIDRSCFEKLRPAA
jgi:hypothetical protein